MRSLERRFAFSLAITLLVIFALLFIGAAQAVRAINEAYVLSRLEHDAEALLASFWVNPRGQAKLREGRLSPIYQQPLSGHYFALNLADGRQLRSRSLWDEDLPSWQLEPGEARVDRLRGPGEQILLLRAAGYEKVGRRFTLVVAEDLAPLRANIQRFQRWTLLALAIALVFIVLTQRWILRRGFRSLDQVRTQLRQVANGQASRINELGPEEVRPLSNEVNQLLERLQQRLARSRQALGDLAHGLKGPLSLVTRELDASDLPSAQRDRLNQRLGRVGELIERELQRARAAGGDVGRHFDPSVELPDLLDALRTLHRERNLSITSESQPEILLPFDREDLLEILGNLLDNACKWAQTRVCVHWQLKDEMLVIQIDDDGPGIPPANRDRLLQRGSRQDEQHPGHGLGLAIVKDRIDELHGRLALAQAPALGGLRAEVSMPLPTNSSRS